RSLLRCDEIEAIGLGTAPESRRHQSRFAIADPLSLRRRPGAPDARPTETAARHRTVPPNSLQGHSGRRRRDASVLDADALQDPIVAAGARGSSYRLQKSSKQRAVAASLLE